MPHAHLTKKFVDGEKMVPSVRSRSPLIQPAMNQVTELLRKTVWEKQFYAALHCCFKLFDYKAFNRKQAQGLESTRHLNR